MSLKGAKTKLAVRFSRKTWIIIAIIVAVLLTTAYILVSIRVWDDLSKNNERSYYAVQKELNAALDLPVTSDIERVKKLTALQQAVSLMEKKMSNCMAPDLFRWQQSVGSNNESITKCQSNTAKFKEVKEKLSKIISHFKNEQELSLQITTLVKTKAAAETDWPGIAQQWKDAQTVLQKRTVTPSFRATRELAVKKIEAIHASWVALVAANQVKDRAKYEEAVTAISSSYQSLNDISKVSIKDLQPVIKSFESSYAKAFQ